MSCGSRVVRYLRRSRAVTLGVVILVGGAPSRAVEAQETTEKNPLDALVRHWPLGEGRVARGLRRTPLLHRPFLEVGALLAGGRGKACTLPALLCLGSVRRRRRLLLPQAGPTGPSGGDRAQPRSQAQGAGRAAGGGCRHLLLSKIAATDRLRFESFDEGLPRAGQWRNGFDVADINNDGFLDIIHSTPRKVISPPVVFLGNGQGSWTRWEASFPQAPYDYGDVAVADVDDNGLLDIAMGFHLRGPDGVGPGAARAVSRCLARSPAERTGGR